MHPIGALLPPACCRQFVCIRVSGSWPTDLPARRRWLSDTKRLRRQGPALQHAATGHRFRPSPSTRWPGSRAYWGTLVGYLDYLIIILLTCLVTLLTCLVILLTCLVTLLTCLVTYVTCLVTLLTCLDTMVTLFT